MAIDPLSEDVIALRDVPPLCPRRRRGKRPHISCIYRWTVAGCRGVVLESVDVGGTRCTTRQALVRFFERLSSNRTMVHPPRPRPTERAEADVERDLDAEGVTLEDA